MRIAVLDQRVEYSRPPRPTIERVPRSAHSGANSGHMPAACQRPHSQQNPIAARKTTALIVMAVVLPLDFLPFMRRFRFSLSALFAPARSLPQLLQEVVLSFVFMPHLGHTFMVSSLCYCSVMIPL
jgi:hypothetical protein